MSINAEQLRRARRAAGITQAALAEATGVNVTLLKHFETYRLEVLPEAVQTSLAAYFEENGVDLASLDRAAEPVPGAVPPLLDWPVHAGLAGADVLVLRARVADNDARIGELVQLEIRRGWLGGVTDEAMDESRELFARLAENYLILRRLRGLNLFGVGGLRDEDADTHGKLLRTHMTASPVASRLLVANEGLGSA